MKVFFAIILGLVLGIGCAIKSTESYTLKPASLDLESHVWNHRVILLFAPSLEDPGLTSMTDELESRVAQVKERDLVIYTLVPNQQFSGESITKVANRFKVDQTRFTFLLIGKDGTEKMRSSDAVPFAHIFQTIDAMPMRQQEMKRTP